MKIKYIVNARIPTEKAHGYQICQMCEAFGDNGVQLELWVPNRSNTESADIFAFYNVKKNFKIKYLSIPNVLKFAKYNERLAFRLYGWLFYLRAFFKKIDRATVIFTRDSEIAWLFKLRGYRVVYEAHSWPESKIWLYRFFLRGVKIVCITHGLKDDFLQNGFDGKNIMVAADGVDLEKFDIEMSRVEARKKLGLSLDKKIVLYSGHLYEWKGAQTLADASRNLGDNVVVYFVGGVEGDIKSFRKKNKDLCDGGKIALAGHRPYNEIPVWFKAANVFVLPNSAKEKISKLYTSPLKLFEYMASKRPIVASDLPSIREVLNDENSVLFEADNVNELSNKIKLILDNEVLAKKVSQQAFMDAEEYSWNKRAKKVLKYINI